MLIDSHVNLHAPQFAEDREAVIDRARAAGVGLMVTICDRVSLFPAVLGIAETHADIWCSVGTHPHESKENPALSAQALADLADQSRVVGIGETGLDFFYDHSPRPVQVAVFRAHIEAARLTGLPLLVHTRDADDEMAEILETEYARGAFKMLLHCYTSGGDLARRAAALGAWFSVSGIATFKAAEAVRAVIADMPAERIIVETDCPYLAPVPMRGRRNEPAFLPHILAKLAEVRGWSLAEAESRTEDAFYSLFDKIPPAMSGELEFTILGCGSSGGVPRADGAWGVCDPTDPRNNRSRCSLLVRRSGPDDRAEQTTVLVDTSPDFRLQMVAAETRRMDGVLFTHDHADQSHGIDDLRVFFLRQRQRIACHMDQATHDTLMPRFGYIFHGQGDYPPICDALRIPDHGVDWAIDGPSGAIPILTFDQDHGNIRSVGYRFGPVAYSADVAMLPYEAFEALRGVEVWIVDALRYRPHPTHAHLARTLEWIDAVRPARAILTNLHIDLDYAVLASELPKGVEPAFDGLRFDVEL